jgi:hypothetical protein
VTFLRTAYFLSRLPTSRTYFCRCLEASHFCSRYLSVITDTSNNAEFLAYMQTKYVTWFCLPRTVHSNSVSASSMGFFQQISLMKLVWPIPIMSLRYLLLIITSRKTLPSIANFSLGIAFRHWNQERFKVSYIKLFTKLLS